MTKHVLFRACLVTTSALVLFLACKKGDTGPAGAAGPKGSANVIYSTWKTTNPWVASTTSIGTGKNTYYFDITAPELTQPVIDSGTVLMYAKFVADPDGTGIIKALPSTYYNLGGASTQYNFQYGLLVGKVRLICDVIPAGTPSATNQARYIIIPGGAPATGRAIRPDYSKMSYSEVCTLLGIPE